MTDTFCITNPFSLPNTCAQTLTPNVNARICIHVYAHSHTHIHEAECCLFSLKVFRLVYLVHLEEGIFFNLKINILETPYYQKLPNKVIK